MRCNPEKFPKSPNQLIDATGGLLTTSYGLTPVFCGGRSDSNDQIRVCHSLGALDPVGFMERCRYGAASIASNGFYGGPSLMLITGGYDSSMNVNLDTSEVLKVSNYNMTLIGSVGVKLKRRISHHCFEWFNSSLAVLYGGQGFDEENSEVLFDLTWIIDLGEEDGPWGKHGEWEQRPNMKRARKHHSCGVVANVGGLEEIKVVIAAGGTLSNNAITDNVELLQVRDNAFDHSRQWEQGPSLPQPLSHAAAATTQGHTNLFVAGGKPDNGFLQSTSIYVFQCKFSVCDWRDIGINLLSPRVLGVALIFPPSIQSDAEQNEDEEQRFLVMTTGHEEGVIVASTLAYSIFQGDMTEYPNHELDSSVPLMMATGGLLRSPLGENVWTPVICGGTNVNDIPLTHCYQLGSYYPLGEMAVARQGAASVVVSNGTKLWITGGEETYAVPIDTTELISITYDAEYPVPLSSSPYLPLPMPLSFHCLELLSDGSSTILYGGQNDNLDISSDTWIVDGNGASSDWQHLGPLATARAGHMCGVIVLKSDSAITEIVVAAGGLNASIEAIDSVELLLVNAANAIDMNWQVGPTLPVTLYFAGAATTEDHARMFVTGGITSTVDYQQSSNVYYFQCFLNGVTPDCQWSKIDQELARPKSSHVALMFPAMATVSDIIIVKDSALSGCNWHLNGNAICNGEANIEACGYDGGDCCSGLDEVCSDCTLNQCHCHMTGSPMCSSKYFIRYLHIAKHEILY